jgi:predicted SAM-dependent methyltransferase
MTQQQYLKTLSLSAILRHYNLFKYIVDLKTNNVLEVGSADGVLEYLLHPFVQKYDVIDHDKSLMPDILGDIIKYQAGLKEKYDLIICSAVLEHLPFETVDGAINNFYSYLKEGGKLIIAVPHTKLAFIFAIPIWKNKFFTITLPIKKKPNNKNHFWEMFDMVKPKDLHKKTAKFKIIKEEISGRDYILILQKKTDRS